MEKNCKICEKSFTGRADKLYCSKACSVKGWKIRNRETYLASKKRYRQKNLSKIKQYNRKYRSEFIKLGSNTKVLFKDLPCQRCGTMSNLNLHHIKQGRYGGDDSVSNIMVLCFDCHMLWHKLTNDILDEYWSIN